MSKENSNIVTDVVSDPNEYFLSPTKGGALKVTIPDELNDDLSAYASGYNTSKSEVVRNSLSNYMGNDPRWIHKQYFFKPRIARVTIEHLKSCLGFVQVACLSKDLPRNAFGYTAKLLKYDDKFSIVTFDLGPGVNIQPPYIINGSDIDLGPGTLVMPIVEVINNNVGGSYTHFKINNELLWGTVNP